MDRLPEPTKNHVAKASKVVGDFLGAVEKHLEGTPGKDGLHQSIRKSFRKFTVAVRASAPDFRPYSPPSKASCDCPIMPYPNVAANNKQAIYLDEVEETASM